MKETVLEKLKVLAESAKYDVSCASSGVTRKHRAGGVGSAAGWGICHSFTADGRCVSLLKIMLTNVCIYDCAYCINRRSNDIPRAAFTPGELAELTIEFYRRNYIEGLFLSSGVVRDPDYTMERMVRVARDLRTVHRFNGYIHLKSIPGASRELVAEAGRYADRMSVNIEIPTERNLQLLAPDKNYESIYRPMSYIQQGVLQSAEERTRFRHAPRFAPAGQSTQMIVGATDESDRDIYGFRAEEIADEQTPRLDLDIDPKLAWALRNPAFFPVDVNRADYEALLRVPGIGVKSARLIVSSRRYRTLTQQSLRQIGVVMKKAQYFISCRELTAGQGVNELRPEQVRRLLTAPQRRKSDKNEGQLTLF